MDQKSFHFHEKKRVVVKIGSSSLNYEETGSLNFTKLEHLVRELCNLRNRGMDVCLVSSGAIAVGRQSLGMTERPRELSTKQACAAVGQARLMMIYQKLFAEYNQVAGQVLMTKNTMVNPVSRENAKNTFDELFRFISIGRLPYPLPESPPLFGTVSLSALPPPAECSHLWQWRPSASLPHFTGSARL